MDKETKEAPKLEYHAPRLERYGTLSELTQTGNTQPGTDFIYYQNTQQYGSVSH